MALKVKNKRKPRITKKLHVRAAEMLIKLGYALPEDFARDGGPNLMFWFRSVEWYAIGWDTTPAFEELQIYLQDELHLVFYGYTRSFSDIEYINTPMRVFKLAKHLYLARRVRGELIIKGK
jgi:hypothetical protein